MLILHSTLIEGGLQTKCFIIIIIIITTINIMIDHN